MHRARINNANGMVAKLMATAYDPAVWSVEMLVEEGDFWFACQQYRVSTAFHGRARVMWERASHLAPQQVHNCGNAKDNRQNKNSKGHSAP